jgi:hypothetical protein
MALKVAGEAQDRSLARNDDSASALDQNAHKSLEPD